MRSIRRSPRLLSVKLHLLVNQPRAAVGQHAWRDMQQREMNPRVFPGSPGTATRLINVNPHPKYAMTVQLTCAMGGMQGLSREPKAKHPARGSIATSRLIQRVKESFLLPLLSTLR